MIVFVLLAYTGMTKDCSKATTSGLWRILGSQVAACCSAMRSGLGAHVDALLLLLLQVQHN